ncbi:hypothetical protein Acr_00g0021040 [Actinidia rufa]|uniref:Uncharacterized protein n=1 Tax=Actinidia rufa TaxID=165716 RepID=A0A7J0DC69_9ERIC|nr:hypothetical protein Acr_00g0021040 [Actinidia rufa]
MQIWSRATGTASLIWLIHHAGLRFLISLMFREVMVRCHLTFMQVSINFVRTMLAVDALMRQLELPFSIEDLLHVYTVVRLKREPGTPVLKVWKEGVTLNSLSYASSNLWIVKGKKGEEVISWLMVNRRRNWALPLTELEISHFFREGYDIDVSSGKINMGRFRTLVQKKPTPAVDPPTSSYHPGAIADPCSSFGIARLLSLNGNAKLWKPKFSTAKLGKRVTVADSIKDHETSLALVHAVMLLKDVVDLAEEGSKEIKDLLIMQQVQSLQRAFAILERMKEQFVEIKKFKNKISSREEKDASNIAVSEARGEVATIQEQLDKALELLVELEKDVSGPVYKRVYNQGIDRADDNYDKPQANLRPGIFLGWLVNLFEGARRPSEIPSLEGGSPHSRASGHPSSLFSTRATQF